MPPPSQSFKKEEKYSSLEELKKAHKEYSFISVTANEIIAFTFPKKNNNRYVRIKFFSYHKDQKLWKRDRWISGSLGSWFPGIKNLKKEMKSNFLKLLRLMNATFKNIDKKLIKNPKYSHLLNNPLVRYLDSRLFLSIIIKELIPLAKDPSTRVDAAYVFFIPDVTGVKSTDVFKSKGIFQIRKATHNSLKKKFPDIITWSFEESKSYERQITEAILLTLDNLTIFYNNVYSKSRRLKDLWKKAERNERIKFVSFLVAVMHNAGVTGVNRVIGEVLGVSKYYYPSSQIMIRNFNSASLDTVIRNSESGLRGGMREFSNTPKYAKDVLSILDVLSQRGFKGEFLSSK